MIKMDNSQSQMVTTLLLLSNNYKIKLMKQKVSCNKLVVSNLRDPYIPNLQCNVMPLQIVNAFNRIRILSNSNLNLTKRKERNVSRHSLNSKTQQVNEVLYDK